MDNTNDLKVLLDSRHGLILADTPDEERFFHVLRRAADDLGLPVWTWSAASGLAREGYSPQYLTDDPHRALEFIAYLSAPGVFVFADAHPIMTDPVVLRHIKEVAQSVKGGQTIVLTAPAHDVPAEIASLAHRWRLRPPAREELKELVERTLADLGDRGFTNDLDDHQTAEIVDAIAGLATREAERLIQAAALSGGGVTADDIAGIRTAKAELLAADGILELIESDVGCLDDVGGFDNLKKWLAVRRKAIETRVDVDPLRGILLTGIPGCGKSLLAKTLARTWGLPLVLLDPARLYSKYIGESEQRLAASLETVEAMSPVVLWIDEIEKGFATGGSSDGGTSRRLLGTFLRWMQDHTGSVFLVATANDISSLPPELLRKGRFDELFFVDLPDIDARRRILDIHFGQRNIDASRFDVDAIARTAEGYSGAEIEAAVVGAVYRAVSTDSPVGQADVLAELEAMVPLSVSRAEEVAALRTWAKSRAITA